MINSKIEKVLYYPERMLRLYRGKLLFGPVSERLFADCLDKKPGFCGNIDFIHKINLDVLFELKCSTNPNWGLANTMWYPTRLTMDYEDENLIFKESKLLTQNDIAYSVSSWTNKSKEDIFVSIKVNPSCSVRREGKRFVISSDIPMHDILITGVSGWNLPGDEAVIHPGESLDIVAAGAVGNFDTETVEEVTDRLEAFFALNLTPEQYIQYGVDEYEKFFEGFPKFESNDPVLNKTWWYRMYILRNSTSKPNFGYLKYPTVYEGRGHKTKKGKAFSMGGWEFSRLICLSSPLHLTDYRWYADKELLHDFIRGYYSNLDENGVNQSVFVNHRGGSFANFLVWAIYNMYLVDGDKEFIKEMLPLFKQNVDGTAKMFASENDSLVVEVRHQRTGKECQPSFWYFTGYPMLPWERKKKVTPLKRVDSSVYQYLNTKGLAGLMEAVGDSESETYKEKAQKIADDLANKSWDADHDFFYDLHYETDEKALDRNIVGIYPYWAGITDESMKKGFESLFDPEIFNTGCLFATTEKNCTAYSSCGAWMGFMTSRDSCMWNGPSWPYTNGIAIDAIGKQSRLNNHCYDKEFAKYIRDYSMQHYRFGDIHFPYLVEQYNSENGEELSDEPDYNHSYYMNLIVDYVVGLSLRTNEIVIDPVNIGLKNYSLDNVTIRGHRIEIIWDECNGMTITSDGNKLIEDCKNFPVSFGYEKL